MAGKYAPLEDYLRALPPGQREAELSFEQVEGIVRGRLPSSAYEDQRWWEHETEGNHVNTRAWANAGWKIGKVDVRGKRVRLLRVR